MAYSNVRTLRSGNAYHSADPYVLFGDPLHPNSNYPLPSGPTPRSADQIQDTLAVIQDMLGKEPPKSPFETNLVNCVNLLIAQMREMKAVQQHQATRYGALVINMQEIKRSSVQTEQYSRRDCLTVTGLTKTDTETTTELGPKIVSALNKSGVNVKIDDFSAFHRNQQQDKTVTLRDGTTKKIPPSVTVKFKSVNQKDDVVRNFKNFYYSTKKPANVQIFHSLSPHYAGLRKKILEYYKSGDAGSKTVKWVRYLSPSAGLAVKLSSDDFVKNIHVFEDFLNFALGPNPRM